MNRFLLLAITLSLSFQVYANIILAEVDKETAFYSDYEQHNQIGKIKKGEILEIISKAKAHSDDKNYWRFDLQVNKASIRVDYKGTAGYVDFFSLKSTRKENISFLRRFSNKVLLPVYYCDALYHQDINYLIKFDPFIKNYDKGIKYFFVDDRKQEWIFNYPINYSFCNDLYLQIGSRPGRYFFNCFI